MVNKRNLIIAAGAVFLFVVILIFYRERPGRMDNHNGFFCKDCNVILISLDSLRPDHLGFNGYKRNTSPNLDKWAEESFVFDQYITAGYLTPVSEMSLHTSLYPSSSGVINFGTALSPESKTLAEIFKSAGYKTAAIGSSIEFIGAVAYSIPSGTPASSLPVYVSEVHRKSFERGFDRYFTEYLKAPEKVWLSQREGEVSGVEEYSMPKYFRGLPFQALDFLKNPPEDKFFLWMPIGTIHWPYNNGKPFHFADSSYKGVFRNDQLSGSTMYRIYKGMYRPVTDRTGTFSKLSDSDLKFIMDRYDDGIYLTDQFLGKFFQTLKDTGLDKKTIVVFAAEHGEDTWEHGYFSHHDIFDTQVKTPLLIKHPGLTGKRIKYQVSSIDVLPSLLEMLGIKSPPNIQGMSFLPMMKSENDEAAGFRKYSFIERTPLFGSVVIGNWKVWPGVFPPQDYDYLEEYNNLDEKNNYRDVAVRTDGWKLIYRESREIEEKFGWWRRFAGEDKPISEFELYDLKNDPNETVNVFEKYPEVVNELKAELTKWMENEGNRENKNYEKLPGIQPYF